MPVDFTRKDRYTMEDLLSIMRILRLPDGCPWDREQTHESIRTNLLEETHEAIEAIDTGDMPGLCEELGDVLMQVVFHAQMEEEVGGFTFADVVNGVCRKLITRHPHVFGDTEVSDSTQVLQNWDAIKRAEKKTDGQTDLLRHVPKTLPSLMRAEKVQGRARRVGFDWREISGAWDALSSEIAELKEAEASGDADAMADELGDVLFSVVNVARFMGIDPELALTRSTDKFVRRFGRTEQLAREQGVDMASASMDKLDELWALAKSE